jgi:hypothetical protein
MADLALTWTTYDESDDTTADDLIGDGCFYAVHPWAGYFWLTLEAPASVTGDRHEKSDLGRFDTEDAAKDAAQTDAERGLAEVHAMVAPE